MSGGNTVVCWDTAKLEIILNEAAQNHLSVIIGIDIPGVQYINDYKNENKVKAVFNAYSRIVLRYKDHPAAFAWCLGNELWFPNSPVYDKFYIEYNRLLDMIHNNDPNHPVCTAVINVAKNNIFNIQWRVPALDFIGINIYNSMHTLQEEINSIAFLWDGPYFISEWAPRGGWEAPVTSWQAPFENNSTENAKEYYDFFINYMPVKDPRFLGSLAFYWGSRQEYTHTFYSIFNEDGKPTEIKEVLNDCWKGTLTKHNSPQLTGVLIDDSLAVKDNIILGAGSLHKAAVLLKNEKQPDSLQYSWEIIKEDWSSWGKIWTNFKKPVAETSLVTDSALQRTVFAAPAKEGPYRIFVTVYNSKGYCATANIPFYVIE